MIQFLGIITKKDLGKALVRQKEAANNTDRALKAEKAPKKNKGAKFRFFEKSDDTSLHTLISYSAKLLPDITSST